MTRRLATMCFMAMFLLGVASPSVRAQDEQATASLRGLRAASVSVQPLSDGAKVLGLTNETLQADVELKLRLAGMRVVTAEEGFKIPGNPGIYVEALLLSDAKAGCIRIELVQNARLERNGQSLISVATWYKTALTSSPTAQSIRDVVKDLVDEFLNDWLSVNPKK